MSHLPQCVLCLQPNPTSLVLCADCEAWAQASRERMGLPVRAMAKVLPVPDSPDD